MEKIWHKKKKDQNFVDHNCKCYGYFDDARRYEHHVLRRTFR